MSTLKKWGKEEDAKLAILLSTPPSKGGIKCGDLSQKNIEAIREEHFPDQLYQNFAPLYRKKFCQWSTNQALADQRKKQQ
eukprot:4075986-Ditylum_brightwellii.AAC.1